MPDIDQLSIQITSDSEKAEKAISDLVRGLNDLNEALSGLDVSKITAFSSAVGKLANIGNNTNVTTKAIKGMANQIADSFGIKTKKGIDDIRDSLMGLYEVHKQDAQGFDIGEGYTRALDNVQKAIEANFKYKTSVDSTTQSVKDWVAATNKAGTKIGMADMVQEFGDDFKEMSKVLGSAFRNRLSSTKEGVGDLAAYLEEMNTKLGTQFDTEHVEKGFAQLVETVRSAKEEVLDFEEATKRGIVPDGASFTAVLEVADKIRDIYREQEKYGATSGLTGVASALQQIGNIPDLTGLADAIKIVNQNAPTQVAQAMSDIGTSAGEATTQVEALNKVLAESNKTVIEGNEIKSYGFTMSDVQPIQNVEYPPMVVEQAEAFEEKLLPAIIDTENQVDELYRRMMSLSSVEAVYDAITEKFVEWKTQLMEASGAIGGQKWAIPSVDNPAEVGGYFENIKGVASDCQLAIREVGTTALATVDQFKSFEEATKQAFEAATNAADSFKMPDVGTVPQSFTKVATEAAKAKSEIEKAIEAARNFKQVISDMESGKITFDKDRFDYAVKGYNAAAEAIKNYKNQLLGIEDKKPKAATKVSGDLLSNFVELGEAFEKVSQRFDMVANKMTSLFKTITSPLKAVAEEYVEKFKKMGDVMADFHKNFNARLTKMAAFWKRTMRTFTFMLVRKAITAIIKEIGVAVQSLALYSNAMGTAFNTDISNMVADFQYLGRSIVSVFAPLLNTIAPIIDALVDKIATLISYIGMLFAALGGGTSFTKAKKNVTNYAEFLDSASKSAKNLTMGIDELNILNEKSGGGSSKPYDGWEDAWEEVEIPAWVLDLSDWFKDLWDKFFTPLKEAWERAKQYLIDGFKTMIDSLKKLFGHILDDFFEVWNQEKTIHMFEQMFKIVGDIERVVRNLADQFDKAWEKGKVGLHIFENLRDIMSIIVDHARNVSYYMIGWASEIDFSPMLNAFEELTNSLKPFADFLGGVFEDIMINGVLKYIKYLIEEAIPHLMETIKGIVDAFNFPGLRAKLKPVWTAFEELFENIHGGTTNAIGNLGREVAKFVNSETFTKFLKRVADITKIISKARVEKVLTGLGKGIIKIAEAVVKFVSSDTFLKFLEAIAKWIDSKSVDQIADMLEKIAFAIGLFKFGAFAAEKLAGLFQFFTVITALKNLGTIAKEMTAVATATEEIAKGAGAFTGAAEGISGGFLGIHNTLSPLVSLFGSVATALLEFKTVESTIENLYLGIGDLTGNIVKLVAEVGIAAGAFTLLLGFPAGVIAAGCVAAVAAIKGINDAVNQLNFDHVTDSILTAGDTTVGQIREWYSETTSIVTENVQKWKDAQRDLVQGRADIDHYAESLRGLESAFSSNVQGTVNMSNDIINAYQNMANAITNYIDNSTQMMVQNLEAQRGYLEAQGKDVDEMIANLLVGASDQKDIVNDAVDTMGKARDAYSDAVETYGKDSEQAKKAYDDLKQAIHDCSPVFAQFQSETDKVDTSGVVEQITNLGKSLDLSQYNYEGGWEDAVNNISTSLTEIKTSTEEGMQAINDTYQSKIDELNDYRQKNPWMPEEYYQVEMDAIVSQWSDDTETLKAAATQALDLYDKSLTDKLQDVAANAEAEWDANSPFQRWAKKMGEKDEYVYSQMQNYVNEHLGDTGLTGLINEAYAAIPGNTHQSAVDTMTKLVNDGAAEYERAAGTLNVDEMGKIAYEPYQKIVDTIPHLVDFDNSNQEFINRSINAAKLAAEGAHYDEVSKTVVSKTGESLVANSAELEDYNRLVAGYGVNAMTDEYKSKLEENSELYEAIKVFGQNTVESYNESIEEQMDTTELPITTWAEKIVGWFHDGALLFGSPSQTMIDFGANTVTSFNQGVEENAETSKASIDAWLALLKTNIEEGMDGLKTTFNAKLTSLFSGEGVDFTSSIGSLFTKVRNTISNQLTLLGSYLTDSALPTFRDTYLMPFFSEGMWQPLFDMLHANVFLANYDRFIAWFNDEAMTMFWDESLLPWFETDKWDEDLFIPLEENIKLHYENFIEWWDETILNWWEEHLIKPWFTKEKWDEDVFTPLKDNIYEHFRLFLEWWDVTLENWWKEHVMPYFEKERWREQFEHISEVEHEVFNAIQEHISESINSAKDAVTSACGAMCEAIASVIEAINDLQEAMAALDGIGAGINVNFSGKFASGGFPTAGSLFLANEAGAELVGNVGGRTGVVSNNEITGIADAVYETGSNEATLLAQLVNLTRQVVDKEPVIIGDREIARMANNGQNQLGMNIIS